MCRLQLDFHILFLPKLLVLVKLPPSFPNPPFTYRCLISPHFIIRTSSQFQPDLRVSWTYVPAPTSGEISLVGIILS